MFRCSLRDTGLAVGYLHLAAFGDQHGSGGFSVLLHIHIAMLWTSSIRARRGAVLLRLSKIWGGYTEAIDVLVSRMLTVMYLGRFRITILSINFRSVISSALKILG